MLIAMAGLPGSGKSAVANEVARTLGCAVLSVDPIEAAMWRAGIGRDQPTGLGAYVVAEDLAREQLRLGNDVVVDAVNDVEPARDQWRSLSAEFGQTLVFVEVFCSDEREHQARLASRRRQIDGFPEPTWESVVVRKGGFSDWHDDRVRVDSMRPLDELVEEVLEHLARVRTTTTDGFMITGLDHVQVAIPVGSEPTAREYYGAVLGMEEIPKPPPLAVRGGCWFTSGSAVLHLGVEEPFAPARKAHPAFLVTDLDALAAALEEGGDNITHSDGELPGIRRFHTSDPFGNRLEFQQA